MTGLEITLLLVGIIFMVGSFLITEKLSGSELDKVSELSEDEIRKILDRELVSAQQKIDAQIEKSIEDSVEQSSDRVDQETNEKIMAISEFSDTVMENMNKTHNEIMFLYSMLNDKHATMTQNMEELQKLITELDSKRESVNTDMAAALEEFKKKLAESEETFSQELAEKAAKFEEELSTVLEEKAEQTRPETEEPEPETEEEPVEEQADPEQAEDTFMPESGNHNAAILDLHRQGMPDIEIAKELGLGVGEVRLVLGLFREEEAQ